MTRAARLTGVGHRFEGMNVSGTVAGDGGLAMRGGIGLARYDGFTLGQTPSGRVIESVDVKSFVWMTLWGWWMCVAREQELLGYFSARMGRRFGLAYTQSQLISFGAASGH
jgi:hypothetical protein